MRLTRTIVLLWLVLLAAAAPASAAGWQRLAGPHFEVAGDAPEADLRRAAARLEAWRAGFVAQFPGRRFDAPAPLRVVVLVGPGAVAALAPPKQRGDRAFFLAGDEVCYLALAAGGETDEAMRRAMRDYARYLLEQEIGRAALPAWLAEGLAAAHADAALKTEAAGAAERELWRAGRTIPFDLFLAQDHYTLAAQTEETAAQFRAQARLFVRSLLGRGEDGAAAIARFVRELERGGRIDRALALAFGADARTLESEFKRFLGAGQLAPLALTGANAAAAPVSPAAPLDEANAKALVGDLLRRAGRAGEAEKTLVEAVRSDARAAAPLVALGFLRVDAGKFEEARRLAAEALALDEKYYLAHYLDAFATARGEMSGYGFVSGYTAAQAERMRARLRRTIELAPGFAAAHELLALVDFVRNEQIDEGLAAIERAAAIAPGNHWFRLRRAQLLSRRERFTDARRLLLEIIPHASDDRLKVAAENALSVMNSLEAQLLSLRNERYRIPDDGVVTDEPVSEEELRRRREKAMIESLNQALRVPDPQERRVLGYVTSVECRSESVIVSVRAENRLLRLRAASIGNLLLKAYDNAFVATEFGCDRLVKEGLSVVTFRPAATAGEEAGELVAVEFVPKYFKFVGQK